MEIFLILVVLALLGVSTCLNLIHFKHIREQLKSICEIQKSVCDVITEQSTNNARDVKQTLICVDRLDRSLLALRESLDAAKPIKPNNWDSIKEAFKGPARVEINERN